VDFYRGINFVPAAVVKNIEINQEPALPSRPVLDLSPQPSAKDPEKQASPAEPKAPPVMPVFRFFYSGEELPIINDSFMDSILQFP
jgi:hypothetical protein